MRPGIVPFLLVIIVLHCSSCTPRTGISENWLDEIKVLQKRFSTELAFTGNNTMEEHDVVADGVVCITYSNGKKVYVNYNSEKVDYNGISINAKDFKVVAA